MSETIALTLLFTDLVGSTALATSLPAAEADELRRTHLALLRDAVSATGGVEVKNLGDGLMVAFASPSRALACAAAMQQAIERHNRRSSITLAIRIGVSGGEVTEEAGDYFGDPVVQAARLCAAAEGGQILVAATVRAMAGRHAPGELRVVGALELRGLPEPVQALELRWATLAEEPAVPLPPRLAVRSVEAAAFPFAGRRAELDLLSDICKRARDALHVALISGEPGVGKTTLAAAAARAAHDTGAIVTFGASHDGLAAPYQPWVTALSHIVAHVPADQLAALRPAHGAALASLLPTVGEVFSSAGESVAEVERYVLLEAVAVLIAQVSDDTPVVIVLDDLQWADAGSVDLLRHLVASSIPNVVIIVTYRSSDLGRDHPLTGALADLRREPSVIRMDLGGLDDAEMVELIRAAAGTDLPPEGIELAHLVRQETGGNPFFTVEVLRHLGESGAFKLEPDGTYALAAGIEALVLPSSVREVVGHRVRRLGAHVERLLGIAGVIGVEFDLDLLAAVADAEEDDVIDALDGAIAAGLVAETPERPGRYRFVHALIAHTLAHDLGPTRCQRLHRRVAETLEAGGAEQAGRVAELAHHWIAATRPDDIDRALYYAMQAGEAALSAYAPGEAVPWFERALALVDQSGGDARRRGRVLADLARAQVDAGIPERDTALREAGRVARSLGDRDLLVRVALARAQGVRDTSLEDPEFVGFIEAALAAVGDDDPATRARLLLALAEETDRRRNQVRFDLVDQAIALADQFTDRLARAEIIASALALYDSPAIVPIRLERVADILPELPDGASRFIALNCWHTAALEVGDRAKAESAFMQMQLLAQGIGTPNVRWAGLARQSFWALLDGDLDTAEALAIETFELGSKIAHFSAGSTFGAQLMAVRLHQGRVGELVDLITSNIDEYETLPGWYSALAFAYAESGRSDAAVPMLDAAYASGFGDVLFDITYTLALVSWAEAATAASHRDAATALVPRMIPMADRVVFTGVHTLGPVARALGRLEALLGHNDDAESHLRLGLALSQQLRAPYWIARSTLDLADFLRASGRLPEAAIKLSTARDVVEQHGFEGLRPRL